MPTNWSAAAKTSNFSLNAASFLRYLQMCDRLWNRPILLWKLSTAF